MVFMPHWPVILGRKPIQLGLERITTLLERLGNPHQHLPPVVHVAGTNGKGSTIAFLRAMIEAAGYKAHIYTSPHLVRFNERIVLGGNEIEDEPLEALLEECRLAAEGLEVTFFEGTTAAALLAFSRHPADILLLETGLGGRLDATNVIEEKLATIITSIDMDHMEYLGPSLKHIAGEKAHIMRSNVPCICSPQLEEVMGYLQQHAAAHEVPLVAFNQDWTIAQTDQQLAYQYQGNESLFPLPVLPGIHQYINAGTAITAAKTLAGFTIDDQAIASGLEQASWPARLQELTDTSFNAILPTQSRLFLDGGHNPAAAFMLANWIAMQPEKSIYLIVGLTKGKDAVGFFEPFREKVSGVFTVFITDEPSSQSAQEVAQAANICAINAQMTESVEQALASIKEQHPQDTPLVICCGSLFLAAGILKRLS